MVSQIDELRESFEELKQTRRKGFDRAATGHRICSGPSQVSGESSRRGDGGAFVISESGTCSRRRSRDFAGPAAGGGNSDRLRESVL